MKTDSEYKIVDEIILDKSFSCNCTYNHIRYKLKNDCVLTKLCSDAFFTCGLYSLEKQNLVKKFKLNKILENIK